MDEYKEFVKNFKKNKEIQDSINILKDRIIKDIIILDKEIIIHTHDNKTVGFKF